MAVVKTKLSAIFRAIRARIVEKANIPIERVHASLRMNPPTHTPAPDYVTILPLTQTADKAMVEGGGRYTKLFTGRMNVYVRWQVMLDEAYMDDVALTGVEGGEGGEGPAAAFGDPTIGVMDKIDAIEDALEMFLPEDAAGNGILVEPMRQVFVGEPHKNYEANEWGDVVTEWEIKYWRDLTLTE